MEYRGHIGTTEVDAEAGVMHGEVVNTLRHHHLSGRQREGSAQGILRIGE